MTSHLQSMTSHLRVHLRHLQSMASCTPTPAHPHPLLHTHTCTPSPAEHDQPHVAGHRRLSRHLSGRLDGRRCARTSAGRCSSEGAGVFACALACVAHLCAGAHLALVCPPVACSATLLCLLVCEWSVGRQTKPSLACQFVVWRSCQGWCAMCRGASSRISTPTTPIPVLGSGG